MKKINLFLVCIFWLSCSSNNDTTGDQPVILAKVGEATITDQEFILSYEFGFNQHKTGENPKRAYLEKMINELLIAQEGYALKLDTATHVQFALKTIQEERIIEEVFNHYVLEQVEVSNDEILEEINKAAVSFQLRFLPAMSEPHAAYLKQEIDLKGYEQVLEEYSNEMAGNDFNETTFQTPFMTYDQIDPVLLDIVDDLEFKTISDPVFYNNQWVLLMVNDIRRAPLAPEDYEQKSVTYEKVVFNRKAMQGAETFISELMEPKMVETKRSVFIPLSQAMYAWTLEEIPVGNLVLRVEEGTEDYHNEIKRLFDEELVSWDGDNWTVREFLMQFNPARYQMRPDGYMEFATRFADVVALVVRDRILMNLAADLSLEEDQWVQRDIQQWGNKWVFQEARSHFYNSLSFEEEVMPDFYLKHRYEFSFGNNIDSYEKLTHQQKEEIRRTYLSTHLGNYAESLQDTYPVVINEDVWQDVISQEFSQGTDIQTQLFKQNSNRLAFPVVDPNW